MRLFYAIDLADSLKEMLYDHILQLQSFIPFGVKWVDKENLHITFQFIGEVKPNQMSDLEDAFLTSIDSCRAQILQIKSLEIFPLDKPKLIWLRLASPNRDLAKATRSLRKFLTKYGFSVKNSDFIPHISLGRIKNNLMKPQIDFILQKQIVKIDIDVSDISLFESNLTKKGPHYRVIQTYNLT